MSTLAFDTSQDQIVAALLSPDAGVLACSGPPEGSESRAQGVIDVIDTMLREIGVARSSIERIAVGTGPGSFTAIRIGVTVARGLAFALGVPLAGLDSLAIAAQPAAEAAPPHAVVWAAVDARRGELFARQYRRESGIAGFSMVASGPLHACAVSELEKLVGEAATGHTLTVGALAEVAAGASYGPPGVVLPTYGREPDAVPTAQRGGEAGGMST